MTTYFGDFAEDATVHIPWNSNDAGGASITRATNGTISVYKDNSATQSTAGITDTEDFDSLTGVHMVTIDTSADAFYATGSNYSVVLSGATIDGETVNACIGTFSIENRYVPADTDYLDEISVVATVNDASATAGSFVGSSGLSSTNDFYNGMVVVFTGGTLKGIGRKVTDYVGSTKTLDFTGNSFPVAPSNTDPFRIMGLIEN